MRVLDRFYGALAAHDPATMADCYADDARFSDPVFPDLDAAGARAMWRMLLTAGTDLRVTFHVVHEDEHSGVCEWEARYTFSRTGRRVINRIRSEFTLRDGRITVQHDQFSLWRWSAQALGPRGTLLGWSRLVRIKVQELAARNLRKAMAGG